MKDAGVVNFTAKNAAEDGGSESVKILSSSGGGCDTGLAWATFALLLGGIMAFRKKL